MQFFGNLLWVTGLALFSLKGWNKAAQGIALGQRREKGRKP
jgi:hypothetical protein